MKKSEVLYFIYECFENVSDECSLDMILGYVNAICETDYKYNETLHFMNYYSKCKNPLFKKVKRCNHVYFKAL